MLRLPAAIVCTIVAASTFASCGGEKQDQVAPRRREVFFWSHGTNAFPLVVDLVNAPPSKEPLDVLLLFDATGSMKNVISEVTRSAAEIMTSVRSLSANAAFAVASFADYPPTAVPWQLHHDFTLDTARVHQALGRITLQNGGYLPEAYSRGLYEARFLSWRPEARRYLILFGDAPANDPDPGRDGLLGTSDDLRLSDVAAQLARDSIKVIALYDSTTGTPDKSALAEAMRDFALVAQATDGITKPVNSASEVPAAIKAALREEYRPVPGLMVADQFQSWVSVSAAKPADSKRLQYSFDVELRVASGTPSGIYRFPLTAVHGGAAEGGEIGRCMVTIRVGLANYEWRRILLPLYVLFLLLLLARRLGKREGRWNAASLYAGRPLLSALGRLLVVLLLIAGFYAIWRWSPGTIPSAASVVVEDDRGALD